MISTKEESGMISRGRHLLISYTLDIPLCDEKDFPNGFFTKCAENYLKYLENIAKTVLTPKVDSMIKGGARTREIREALSLPINASLVWEHFPCTKDRHAFSCTISAFGNDGSPTVRKRCLLIEKRSMTALGISEKRLRHLLE
ncbi:MAG: hypothetical protein IJZ03_07780 [Clostridia bacterium]|nr:hypothetical protein [Clostridia bacterium]